MGTQGRVFQSPPLPGGELCGLGRADAWCELGESSCSRRRGPGRVPRTPCTVDRAGIVPVGTLCAQARLSWGSGLVWHRTGARKSVTELTHKRLLMFDIKSGGSPHPWASQLPSGGGGDLARWPGAQAGGLLPGCESCPERRGRVRLLTTEGSPGPRPHRATGCPSDGHARQPRLPRFASLPGMAVPPAPFPCSSVGWLLGSWLAVLSCGQLRAGRGWV